MILHALNICHVIIIIITISFSVLQLAFRNMGRRIQEVQISLHAFIVSISVLHIVVKCSFMLPEGVEPAQPSPFFYSILVLAFLFSRLETLYHLSYLSNKTRPFPL